MKKQIIILVSSLFLLIYCGIWELNYLEKTSMYLKSDINNVGNLVRNDNFDMAMNGYDNIENTWNGISRVWYIFINHERIDYLEEEIIVLKSNLENRKKDEALEQVSKLERIVSQILEKQKPTFEHVL